MESTTEAQQPTNEPSSEYEAPELVRHGDIDDLTQGTTFHPNATDNFSLG